MARAIRAAGVLIALAGAAGIALPTPTSAQSQAAAYGVSARADTAGLELVSTEAPAVSLGGGQVVFASPATAQSLLQFGQSDSFASVAYPGDLVVGLPGLVAGFSGGQVSPPGYPTYISSSYPVRPEAEQTAGPYSLKVASAGDSSTATAHIGQAAVPAQVVDAVARTAVTRDPQTGAVTGEATADIAPFTIGPLSVGRTLATAKVVADAGGVRRESDLAVGKITVAGTEVGLTKKGLVAAGGPVPVDAGALSAVLDAAGVEIALVDEKTTDHGIVSGGLRVTFGQNVQGLGDTSVTMLLGRVSVNADPGTDLAAPGAAASGGAPLPSAGLVSGDVVAEGSAPPPAAEPRAVATPAAPAPRDAAVAGRRVAVPVADVWFFYPVLVIGALIALVGSRTETLLAMRSRLDTPQRLAGSEVRR